jgi:hypothetical protein
MLEVVIKDSKVENYFKTVENVNILLNKMVEFDLMSLIFEIENNKSYQKSIDDIKSKNLIFYNNSCDLIKALNE